MRRKVWGFSRVLGCRFPTVQDVSTPEWGKRVLDSWDMMLPNWIYIVPKNMAASNEISQQDVPLRLVKA